MPLAQRLAFSKTACGYVVRGFIETSSNFANGLSWWAESIGKVSARSDKSSIDFETTRIFAFKKNQIWRCVYTSHPYGKNHPRFGFLVKISVDMYVTKFFIMISSKLPKFFGRQKWKLVRKMLLKNTKIRRNYFWWYAYRRKIWRESRIWGYFFDATPLKWSKIAIYYKVWKF